MNEILLLKIIFGIGLGIGGFVILFIAFKKFFKYLIQEKKCTSKAKGIVKKYTLANRGRGIHLPIVYYTVNDLEYKVIGPEYKSYIIKIAKSPLESENKTFFEETENQRLIVTHNVNSFVSIYRNPLQELYPIDSEVDVYYDQKNPKLSYVSRYCNRKFWFWFMLVIGIFVLLIDLLLILFL